LDICAVKHLNVKPTSETDYMVMNMKTKKKLEMWANAQRHGRAAEYSWRPLFNAAKFG